MGRAEESYQKRRNYREVVKAIDETCSIDPIKMRFYAVASSDYCPHNLRNHIKLMRELTLPEFLELEEFIEIRSVQEKAIRLDDKEEEDLKRSLGR